jgi:small subunit ribosomal protein S9
MPKTTVKKTVKRAAAPKETKEPKESKELKAPKPRAVKIEEKTEEAIIPVLLKAGRYCETIGRRKTAIARVRIFLQKERVFSVNDKTLAQYFPLDLQAIAQEAMNRMGCSDKFSVSVRVRGGGLHAQAEAIRHGISRALVETNQDFRKKLKKAGFLTRDPRMRERKKFGLKRARKAPQWAKR